MRLNKEYMGTIALSPDTDVTAGATYSARLIQELVLKAFDHLRGGM